MFDSTEKCLKGCSDLVSTYILSGATRQILNHQYLLVNSALNQKLFVSFLRNFINFVSDEFCVIWVVLLMWQMFLCVKKHVVLLSHVLMDVRLDHQWSPETCCCCELTDCDWITEDVNSLSVA